MACNDIIYQDKKYSEEEFVDLMNSGKITELTKFDGLSDSSEGLTRTEPGTLTKSEGERYGDLLPEHTYIADEKLDINDMRNAYKAKKEEVLAQGARIQIDNGKELKYILPDTFHQSTGDKLKSSRASDQTVKEFTDWFRNTGVDFKAVTKELTDAQGNKLDANESVDVLNGVVRVVEGHENTAIPEAGMHIVARIVKEKYPELFKEMMKRIDKFTIFPEVVNQYKKYPNYQLPDGKPDMAKMKEETIGKVLAEYRILDKEGSTEKPELIQQAQTWWGRIKDLLRDFFKGNPFTKTLKKFNDEVQNLQQFKGEYHSKHMGIETSETSYYDEDVNSNGRTSSRESQQATREVQKGKYVFGEISGNGRTGEVSNEGSGKEQDIFDKSSKKVDISKTQNSVQNMEGVGYGKGNTENSARIFTSSHNQERVTGSDTREGLFYQANLVDKGKDLFDEIKRKASDIDHVIEGDENYYTRKSTGKRVANRVTDRAKRILTDIFGDSRRIPDWDEKAKTGIAGHADINDILERYIDKETGLIRRDGNNELAPFEKISVSQINPKEEGYYDMLKKMVHDIIKDYPSTTRFVWEEPLYDEAKDEVGSPDLLAIHADGTVDNYDWKFLDIKEDTQDIPKYKKKAYNAQMQGYASILRKTYGADKIGRSRIIPIQAVYIHDGKEYKFAGIKTADSENYYKGEHREYLLPLPSSEEKYVEDKRIQNYLDGLNSVLSKMEAGAQELKDDPRLHANEDIKQLVRSIRHLQVKKNVTDSANFAMGKMNELAKTLKGYKDIFDEGKGSEFTEQDLERISGELNNARTFITPFEGLEHYFEGEQKALLSKLTYRVREARDFIRELDNLIIEKGYANKRGIFGVAGIDPNTGEVYADRATKFFQKVFNVSSDAHTRAGQLLHKLFSEAAGKYTIAVNEAFEKHDKVKEQVQEWLKTRSVKDLDKLLLKQGNSEFGRIDRFSREFYSTLKEQLVGKESKWVFEKEGDKWKNVDVSRYMENYEQELKRYSKWAEDYTILQVDQEGLTKEQLEERRAKMSNELVEQFRRQYDIQAHPKTAISTTNEKLYRYPTDNWQSKEYKELLKPENKPVLDYYNFVQEVVDKAKDSGINIKRGASFFPMQEKTLVEGVSGGSALKNTIRNIGSAVTLRPGEGGYADPITKELENKLLVSFIHDIGQVDSKGNKDYTNVSRNIFSVMDKFIGEVEQYITRSEIEEPVKLLLHLEKEKAVISTTLTGTPIYKDGKVQTVHDDSNYNFLKHLVDTGLYDKQGGYKEAGIGWTWDYNKFARKVNKVAGEGTMPLSKEDEVYISVPKVIKTLNSKIVLKALGFNPLSAIANLFGGRMQSWIDNRFVTKEDLNLGRNLIAKANFLSEEGKVAGGLLKFFTPYTHEETLDKARKDDLSAWNKWLSSATLMGMMKGSEEHVQSSNALAYMKNLMVRNGKLMNIWEFVKNKYDYSNLYKGRTTQEADVIKKEMDKEYKELKEKESLLKVSKIVDGKLVIPGLANKTDITVLDAREKMMQMNRDATGSLSPYEHMMVDQNFVGQSMMTFHHWIPPLVLTRFDNLGFNAGSGKYRWGRWKMLSAAIHERGLGAVTQLIGHLTGSEQSIVDIAKHLYQKKRAMMEERGEIAQFDHNITEAEFIDMYRSGMKANLVDAIAALSLLGAYLAIRAAQKDNEDEEKAGIYRSMAKISDKLSDELLFFYSPSAFMQLTGGYHTSLFPALGIATDAEKFLRASGTELFYDVSGDEDQSDKNKVLKYPVSYIPGINQLTSWYALFDDDFSVQLKGKKAPDHP